VSAPRRVQLGEERLLAAREILRHAATLARARDHIHEVAKAYDFRVLSFVENIRLDCKSIERVARTQLAEIDPGDPSFFDGVEPAP